MNNEITDFNWSAVTIHFGYDINNFCFENDPVENISYGIDRLLEDDISLLQDFSRDKMKETFGKSYTVTAYYYLEDKVRDSYPVREYINCDYHQDDKETRLKIDIAHYVFTYIKEKIRNKLSQESDLYKYVRRFVEATLYDDVRIKDWNFIDKPEYTSIEFVLERE